MPSSGAAPSLASAAAVATGPDGTGPKAHRWEAGAGEATWDTAVQEDEDGNIVLAASLSKADRIRKRRQRLEQTDYSQKRKRVIRDMIRYLYLVVDASRWMRTKDPVFPPSTKIDVTLALLQEFVQEYYDQNPLSHLGFIILRNGEAEILSQLSSNSSSHVTALDALRVLTASEKSPKSGGEFSLQNGLEVAGRSLGHQPRHGSREIVVVVGALSTCDPGNVLTETLPRLQSANVRVSTLALSAELHVCRKLAEETGGIMGVCLDKAHFRDWLLGGQCTPPPKDMKRGIANGCEMVHMGFPTRTSEDVPTLVHATRDTKLLTRTAYVCPQCEAKQSQLPTDCPVCGLKLVLAPHLARSFHHLFPVPAFNELDMSVNLTSSEDQQPFSNSLVTNSKDCDLCCFSCLKKIGKNKRNTDKNKDKKKDEVLRFQCPDCCNVFCADCDAYLHDTLHNCPGCLLNATIEEK
mmetsp:Transcript_14705/g.16826  ORF Transcript_14705/g.16826 Transcript_14705/m.16826 type:complete len:465 (-) Transcript_14705:412-1806(-)